MTTTFVTEWLKPENQLEEKTLKDLARCCICGKPAISMCAECCRIAEITPPSVKAEPIKHGG